MQYIDCATVEQRLATFWGKGARCSEMKLLNSGSSCAELSLGGEASHPISHTSNRVWQSHYARVTVSRPMGPSEKEASPDKLPKSAHGTKVVDSYFVVFSWPYSISLREHFPNQFVCWSALLYQGRSPVHSGNVWSMWVKLQSWTELAKPTGLQEV